MLLRENNNNEINYSYHSINNRVSWEAEVENRNSSRSIAVVKNKTKTNFLNAISDENNNHIKRSDGEDSDK